LKFLEFKGILLEILGPIGVILNGPGIQMTLVLIGVWTLFFGRKEASKIEDNSLKT